MTTRRSFLTLLGTLSFGAYGIPCRATARDGEDGPNRPRPTPPAGDPPGSDQLDEALERLAPYAASFRGGLSNHGPMAAEALVSLGRHEAVIGWVESYRKRLEPRPLARKRIDASNWAQALGDGPRISDWDEWFGNELAEAHWHDVVGLWVPRLAPGIAAAGLHGVIRVGHAVSSLAVKETELRLDELARALGYWAAEFMLLPGEHSGAGELPPSRAIGGIELLPRERRSGRGLITTEMKDLVGFEPFVGVIDLVDPSAGSPSFLSDLLATCAGTFANTTSNSFEFLHAVTGAAAIAELLPYVEPEQRAGVLAYTWQVTAGIYCRYGRPELVATLEAAPGQDGVEWLAERAVASGDEHTIKLALACTREWVRNPDPRLLAAAAKRIQQGR